jgi:hypothetical protein
VPVSAILTYSDLQSAVADYAWRGDMTTQIPLFIQMTETEVAQRVRRTTATAVISVSGYSNPLPSDCQEVRAVRIYSSNPYQSSPLYLVSPDMLAEFAQLSNTTGIPQYAYILGNNIVLSPTPTSTSTLEVIYYQKLVPLSSTNTSNVVLAERPDIYLFGALKNAAIFLKDPDKVQLYTPPFEAAVQQLNNEREREEYSASMRPIRVPISFS